MSPPSRLAASLRARPAFTSLVDADLARIEAVCREWDFADETVLYRQGDSAAAFYVLVAGEVRLTTADAERVERLAPEQCFGELDVLEDAPRSATAVAASGSRLFVVARGDFEYILAQSPTLAQSMLESLTAKGAPHRGAD